LGNKNFVLRILFLQNISLLHSNIIMLDL